MFPDWLTQFIPLLAQIPKDDHFEPIFGPEELTLMLWFTGQLLMVMAPFLLLVVAFIFVRDIAERIIDKMFKK